MKERYTFHIISMATYGRGLSGGDRIWIELMKRLKNKYQVFVYLWEEGLEIAKREGLEDVKFVLWSAKKWNRFGFFINYSARIFISCFKTLTLKVENSSNIIVYSASEFWQDSLPSVILKIRFPHIKWIAAWYQTAPNPFKGYNETVGKIKSPLKIFLYWLVQQPVKPLIKRFADLVIVNNEVERKEFDQMDKKGKVFVMLGGIDIKKIQSYRMRFRSIKKIYDGVFQGRFHPQKGVVELIDIWKVVVSRKPDAKLAIIGDGPLMNQAIEKIKDYNLENNISLFGYLFDGEEKYRIFAQSKVVLHPAFYDSGGMAAAEAMVFDLPAVGFDLAAYESYYPKGMVKVKLGNLEEFAQAVIKLLTNREYYQKTASEGVKMLESEWSWEGRINSLLKTIYVI